MTDQEVVDRFIGVQEKLTRYVYGILRSTEDAQDVVQDTFIKLLKVVRADRQPQNIEAWCMRVSRNRAFDMLKKTSRQDWTTDKIGEMFGDEESDFTERDVMDERWEIVESCINELPDRYRDIILLRDVEGLSYKNIAELSDKTLSQVKVTIHRARQHLKEKVLRKYKHEHGSH